MQPNTRCLFTVVGILALAHAALAEPALTIYNQQFAVVRDTLELDLKTGPNNVSFSDVTAHLEPDSVILRDPEGKVPLLLLSRLWPS